MPIDLKIDLWERNAHSLRRNKAKSSRGFSLIELLIVVAIILLRSRMAANEASAVGSIRTMNTAATSYNSTYGNGFPPGMAAIGNNGTTTISCTNAELIDTILTSGTKSGYQFVLNHGLAANVVNSTSSTCSGGYGYSDGNMVTAVPSTVGTTGQRSFCTDASGVIRFNTKGTVNAGPSPNCATGDSPLQ
jgi:type IV pilus assembly protein PilA